MNAIYEALDLDLKYFSMSAYKAAVTILCVALAAAVHWGFGLVWPDIADFVTFYPTIVVVTLACGVEAGVMAIALATFTCWWIFIPPPFAFFPLKQDDAVSLTLFVISSTIIVAAVQPYVSAELADR